MNSNKQNIPTVWTAGHRSLGLGLHRRFSSGGQLQAVSAVMGHQSIAELVLVADQLLACASAVPSSPAVFFSAHSRFVVKSAEFAQMSMGMLNGSTESVLGDEGTEGVADVVEVASTEDLKGSDVSSTRLSWADEVEEAENGVVVDIEVPTKVDIVPEVRADVAGGAVTLQFGDMPAEEFVLSGSSVGSESEVDEGFDISTVGGFAPLEEATGGDAFAHMVVPEVMAERVRVEAAAGAVVPGRGSRRVVRNQESVGGFVGVLKHVSVPAGAGLVRAWVDSLGAGRLPKKCGELVLASSFPSQLGPGAKTAYGALAMVGDRSLSVAMAYHCLHGGRSAGAFQTMRNSLGSNASLGRALVQKGLAAAIPTPPGVDLAVGRAGGTAFEVIVGMVALRVGMRAVQKIVEELHLMNPGVLAGEAVIAGLDDESSALAADFSAERGVSLGDLEARVSAFKALVQSVTGHRYPKTAPELFSVSRSVVALPPSQKEGCRTLAVYGSEWIQLALAVDCYMAGNGVQIYDHRRKFTTVDALSEIANTERVRSLFCGVDGSGKWGTRMVRAHAVYMLVGAVGRRMTVESVVKVCRYLGIVRV